jgi:Protein of unknown function (DUF3089)
MGTKLWRVLVSGDPPLAPASGRVALLLLTALAVGCTSGSASGSASAPDAGTGNSPQDASLPGTDAGFDAAPDAVALSYPDGGYANASMWLCGAGAAHDYCLDPQTATAILPDLTQTTSTLGPASDPPVDCFYVYPSVDVTDPAGNIPTFSNLPDILDPVHEQAAPFSQVCKVYAPLYHQATYESYFSANADQYLEVAYADVAAAFQQYLTAWNGGRDFVLLGHSQGTHMLRRLIQRVIETNPDLQKHLVVAILNGSLGDITVPKGQLVGGSFQSTPLCTSDAQRGCLISVNTFAKGYEPTSTYGTGFSVGSNMDIACTNPAALAGGKARLTSSAFFTQFQNPNIDPPQSSVVSTTFAVYGNLYAGECLPAVNGLSFFEIDPEPLAGDTRNNPIPFSNVYYDPALLGLHLLDYAFPMQDLIGAVQKRSGGAVAEAGEAGEVGAD